MPPAQPACSRPLPQPSSPPQSLQNAVDIVPPCLAFATALEQLDMARQQLRKESLSKHTSPVQGLHVLDELTRLRQVTLVGCRKGGAGSRRFRAAHPSVAVVI